MRIATFVALGLVGLTSPSLHAVTDRAPTWMHVPGFYQPGMAGAVVLDLNGDGRQEAVFTGKTWSEGEYRDFLARLSQRDGALRFDEIRRLPEEEQVVDPILVEPGAVSAAQSILAVVQRDGVGAVLVRFSGPQLQPNDIATLPHATRPLQLADVDADGQIELLATVNGFATLINAATGTVEWSSPTGHFNQHLNLGAGQLDDDSALELMVGDDSGEVGTIFDGATRSVEWTYFGGFRGTPLVGEFDGNPLTREFVVVPIGGPSTLFTATPVYSPVSSHDVGEAQSIAVANIRGDARDELIIGAGQWGNLKAYTPQDWTFEIIDANPEHGTQSIAIGQLDADAALEVAYSGGLTASGGDIIRVVDGQSGALQFSQLDASGPHSTALLVDLQADGGEDLVVATRFSDSKFGGPRLYVVGPQTGQVQRADQDLLGDPWGSSGGALMMAHNLDADPQPELIIGGGELYDPLLLVRDGASLELEYFATDTEEGSILRQQLIHFNSDGVPDIVAAAGARLLVFDGASGASLWRSPTMTLLGMNTQLAVANVDADAAPEILVTTQGAISIFDVQTRLLQSQIPTSVWALGLSVERDDDACHVVVLEFDRLVRRDCASGMIASERAYAVPGAVLALAPEGSDGRIVLSDGERLYLQDGADVVARSTALGPTLGWDSRAAVKIASDTVTVYTGDALAFYRIDLTPGYLFGDGFE